MSELEDQREVAGIICIIFPLGFSSSIIKLGHWLRLVRRCSRCNGGSQYLLIVDLAYVAAGRYYFHVPTVHDVIIK